MKRLLSLLTVMLMLVTVFALSVTANAANTYASAYSKEGSFEYANGETATIIINSAYSLPSDTITLHFEYDEEYLDLVLGGRNATSWINLGSDAWYEETQFNFDLMPSISAPDALIFVYDGITQIKDPEILSGDLSGDIFRLMLKVKDSTPVGSYDVSIQVRHMKGVDYVMDETVTVTIIVPCPAHNFIEVVDDQYLVSEANCQSPAIYKKSCEHCGAASATETFENGTKLDHTYTNGWVTDGDDTHTRKCDNFAVCGYSETLAHNWDNGSVTDEPSCFEKGTKTYTCTDNCGATKEEDIDPTGNHTYGEWVKVDDSTHSHTCTIPGCGASEPGNHTWDGGSIESEPTCYKLGVKKYTCTDNCGATKEENYGTLEDHTYGDWTPNNDGTHSRTCQVAECGHVDGPYSCSYNGIVQIVGDKEHHKEVCTVCEYDHLLDHNWGTGVETKAPSCAEGERTYTCECGEQKTEAIPATGEHDYTGAEWVSIGDYKHIMECNNCDEYKEEVHTLTNPVDNGDDHVGTCSVCGETDAHEAHNWDNGSVTDEPSCFEKGTMTYTCTDGCGATKEEDIDPTNAHVWGAWADNGDNHVRYCTTVGCGEPNYADHDWSHNCDTLCDTCGHTRTVVHIYGHVATADEHWNACGICGDIEPGSRAPHNVVNGECADCGYKTSRPMSGFFYVNDDYHMMVLTDGVITGHHILDVNGNCTICGAHISDVVEDEIVIEAPVESNTEETETEPVVNPTTGLAFALITVAAAAAVAVASKKH